MSALYRRYRPQNLAHVVGQRHVVQTLSNAIEHDRVRHAYLFAGPRGTGKTSLAKILGKSLNCQTTSGPTTTPCLQCESCRTIGEGTALDVLELDAASNRGIDDIRDIRDRVAQQPVLGRYRVYILDEAHSLTTDAANALLKTLEEPPPHVLFILCTTEPHRLPDTVRGRCQSFTFLRPTADELIEVLERIALAEQISADDDVLRLIARHAGGSFRDAVSTLDQLSAAGSGLIEAKSAQAILGVVDEEVLTGLVDAVSSGDAPAALTQLDGLVEGGQDLGRLIRDLVDRLRMVLLTLELGAPPKSAMLSTGLTETVAREAQAITEGATIALIDGLLAAESALRSGGDPRLALEILLIKAARPSADRSLEGALRRIELLEGGAPLQPAKLAPVAAVVPVDPPILLPPPPLPPPVVESSDAVSRAADTPPWDEPTPPPASTPLLPASDLAVTAADLREVWEIAKQRLSPKLRSIVTSARPLRIERGALVLGFPSATQFQKSQADREQNRAELAAAASAALGADVRIVLETLPDVGAPPPVTTAAPNAEDDHEDIDPITREEEFVRTLVETLDAREEEIT